MSDCRCHFGLLSGRISRAAGLRSGEELLMMLSRIAWYSRAVIDKKLSEYFSALGRKSVKARMKNVSAKRRKEIARDAANARWTKQRQKKTVKAGRKS